MMSKTHNSKDTPVDQELGLIPSTQEGEVVDAVFGAPTGNGPKFRDVSYSNELTIVDRHVH